LRDLNSYRERLRRAHRLVRVLIAGIALTCFVSAAFALDPTRRISQYVHDKWGKDRGFIGGSIHAIRQSADGYLWIGTERGLVRFDGFGFTLIQSPMADTIPVGPVRGLVSDVAGNLWIRLEGPRILFYRDGKFEDSYPSLDLEGITFTATATDYDGRVFLSGLGDKTLRYKDGHLDTIVSADENPGTVISLAATRDESVWLGTQDAGIFRVRQGHISRVAQKLKDLKINCLLPAQTGGLWIGTDHGIHLWEGGELAPLNLPSSLGQLQILTMARDHDANVWIGTNHGIVRITPSGVVSLEQLNSKPGYEVTAIYEDFDGDIWFGGSRGIERLRNGMLTTYSAADGLPSGGNGAVYSDSVGRIWVAPLAGGLYWMKDGQVGHIALDGIEHDVVYSISGGDGEIWVGRQRGGLTVLSEKGDVFTAHTYTQADGLAQNSVYSVHREHDGSVWAGTISGGVSRLYRGKFINYSSANGLYSDSVNSIVEGFDGTTWLATPGGLAAFSNGQWTNYTTRDGLPSLVVRTIFQDTKHVLWIASAGGLAYLSSGRINVPPNLPDPLREQVFGVAEDGMGSLWLSTSDQVLRVDEDRLLSGSLSETDVQSYGIEDGLPDVEGVTRDRSVVADRMGRVWLSLASGLSLADPIITSRNAIPVTARIESISAGGHQISSQNPIKIAAGIQSIGLTFGGTNLAVPERIRFRYKLDGSAQGWSDVVTTKQVVFSNLGPGKYVFHIAASNGVGLWNGPETSFPFVIEPSFWQTWWFRILCIVAFLSILWSLYVVRLRQVTALLRIRHHERLSEREDMSRDLHDTFFQAVQSLFLRLHTATYQLRERDPARQALEGVLDDSDRVMMEGREMFLDIPKREVKKRDMGDLIADYCAEFARAHPIEFKVEIDGQPRVLDPLVATELSKIAREALYNAFRHAEAGAIEAEVSYGTRLLRLRIRDDGKGFEPENVQSNSGPLHLGLRNMRKRAETINAEFNLWSRPGSGTEVEVIITAEHAYIGKLRAWPFSVLYRKN
jgi:ligand-binding sensor domain-containing protein/signal transduction histidine kinase